MIINIGIGLDKIIFGMKQDDVTRILGEPDKINKKNEELDGKVIFYYNDKMLKLKFDSEEDLKLYAIEVFKQDVLMLHEKLIGTSKSKVINILKKNNISDLEYEEYTSFDTIFCESIWTTFEFEFEKLRSIEFSPLIKNNSEIIWPKIHTG